MDVPRVAQIVLIMLSPTIAVAIAIHSPRVVAAAWRRAHPAKAGPTAVGRPIEQVAADLWRLLRQHESTRLAPGVARRALHLRALEGAITDCAIEAAGALRVPCPDRARAGLSPARLRELLRALADAGLAMPPAVGLLSGDRRI